MQFDSQFEEQPEPVAISCVQSMSGRSIYIVGRADYHMRSTINVHTPHAYGIDPNHSGFTSRELYCYRNFELDLNLIA